MTNNDNSDEGGAGNDDVEEGALMLVHNKN